MISAQVLPCCPYNVGDVRCDTVPRMCDELEQKHGAIHREDVAGVGLVLWATFGRPWHKGSSNAWPSPGAKWG